MTFGQKLKLLLKQRHMTQVELSKHLGLRDSSAVTNWIKDRYHPSYDNMERISQVLEKPVTYFAEEEDELDANQLKSVQNLNELLRATVPQPRVVPVGVLGLVSAENFHLAVENTPDEYLPVLVEGSGTKRIFALKIKGACMEPSAHDGDYAVVEEADYVDDGKLAVLRLGNGYTLKRVFRREGYVELKPDNPKFKPLKIASDDLKVVGQVKLFCRKP